MSFWKFLFLEIYFCAYVLVDSEFLSYPIVQVNIFVPGIICGYVQKLFFIHSYFWRAVSMYASLYMNIYILADQDNFTKCDQMRLNFQHISFGSPYTSSFGVAVVGFHWSKSSTADMTLSYELFSWLLYS